jgi:hypothetical protein
MIVGKLQRSLGFACTLGYFSGADSCDGQRSRGPEMRFTLNIHLFRNARNYSRRYTNCVGVDTVRIFYGSMSLRLE